jgi:hypothetical protein
VAAPRPSTLSISILLMEVDVEMMDIMTMMEMWFALVARAPAQVDRINLEPPGTVWPAPD